MITERIYEITFTEQKQNYKRIFKADTIHFIGKVKPAWIADFEEQIMICLDGKKQDFVFKTETDTNTILKQKRLFIYNREQYTEEE